MQQTSSPFVTPALVIVGVLSTFVYWRMTATMSENDDQQPNEEEDAANAFLKYQPYEPPATISSDLKVVKAMWFANITGTSLQDRLESFYESQADLYDSYRFRMLHGRPKMLKGVARHITPSDDSKKGIVWVDLACGTGANVENFASSMEDGSIAKVYLVDLCRPLCDVAVRERGEKYGADKVQVIHGDVTDLELQGLPPAGTVDLVTISYAVVMIPDWKKCLENAKRLLKPGGIFGAADFTVAPDQWNVSKNFWTNTFKKDHVYLDPKHLPTLKSEFDELESEYDYGTFPYTPFFMKSAYFHFVGRKRE
mmetsp:Transcript_14422/g.21162  ORF Transcript_14422/g.21162 Transcript_14422/m.21162 type:complete len:310 (-) Transcript_14422:133-1062(-)